MDRFEKTSFGRQLFIRTMEKLWVLTWDLVETGEKKYLNNFSYSAKTKQIFNRYEKKKLYATYVYYTNNYNSQKNIETPRKISRESPRTHKKGNANFRRLRDIILATSRGSLNFSLHFPLLPGIFCECASTSTSYLLTRTSVSYFNYIYTHLC